MLFVLCGLLICSSCKKESAFSFSSEIRTEGDLTICEQGACPEITINYILMEGEDEVAKKINTAITSFIRDSL